MIAFEMLITVAFIAICFFIIGSIECEKQEKMPLAFSLLLLFTFYCINLGQLVSFLNGEKGEIAPTTKVEQSH